MTTSPGGSGPTIGWMRSEAEHVGESLVLFAADAEAMHAIGACFGRVARAWEREGLVLVLNGDLGAGKTVFVKGVAIGLGLPSEVSVVSPTFTIARSYPVPGSDLTLHHLDAYRLGGGEDLENIGFEEMCGEGCVTCVEWGSRVQDALPEGRIDLWIEMLAASEPYEHGAVPRAPRRLRLQAQGARSVELLSALRQACVPPEGSS